MSFIISIIQFLISAYIIYKCFEKYDFKITYGIYVGISLLFNIIQNGFSHIFGAIISILITNLIVLYIDYKIYQKSTSFWNFVALSVVVSIIVAFVISLIAGGILALTVGGSLFH